MYNPEAVSRAFSAAGESRTKAIAVAAERKETLEKKLPRLAAISAELTRVGAGIAKAFYSPDPVESMDALAARSLNLQRERAALLNSCGYPENYLEPPFSCPKCNDTGRINGKICTCIQRRAVEISLEELSRISPSKRCSFESFDLNYYKNLNDKNGASVFENAKNNYEYLKAYSEDFSAASPNLYIFGKTGLGKTHLTLAAANEIIKKGYDVLYGMAGAIFASVEDERFHQKPGKYTMKKLLEADLLIIDDLGSEFHTSFTASVVHNVIEGRLLASKPVIITTNLDIRGINKQYGERIASRIIGEYEPIKFEGEDIRQLKKFQY